MGNKLTLETAQNKLSVHTERYILREYIPGANTFSIFYDSELDREVSYKYNHFIQKLKRNPDFVPKPSKELKQQLYKQGYQKRKQALLDEHGVEHPSQLEYVKEKKKQTNLERYGVVSNLRIPEVVEKVQETFQEKYNAGSAGGNPETIAKSLQTKKDRGNCSSIDGKTIREWAQKLGKSTSNIYKWLNHSGVTDPKDIPKISTRIEQPISAFLDSLNVNYIQDKQLSGSTYRPDFLLPDHKLIIECDGLYWHSDAINKDKYYHRNKQKEYTKLGYKSLFFREDEILNKPKIVQSIITNALHLNTAKIFARKCTTQPLDKQFFSDHHLMGLGAGRCYGLFYQNQPVLGIQVKWVNKETKLLEVSRFCSAPNTSVTGGFSKLLKHIEQLEQPNQLQTFIDRRYGTGSYLKSLNFDENKTYVSFKWTDNINLYNRMQFRGNTGYEYGFFRLWDCGQTKWVKKIGNESIRS